MHMTNTPFSFSNYNESSYVFSHVKISPLKNGVFSGVVNKHPVVVIKELETCETFVLS